MSCIIGNLEMFPLILLLFSVSLGPSSSVSTNTIFPGESLSRNRTLISRGGTFEMGFFSPGNTGKHYIGIWYKGLPQKTVVWVANRNRSVSDPFSSELKLLRDGNLVIVASSKCQIWSTSLTTLMPNSTSGVLLDSGNFILRKKSNVSSVVWQTFDHPTDTWLPGAKFVYSSRTSERTVLVAWRDLDDPAPGIYSAVPEAEEKVELALFNRSVAYWHSGDWTGANYGHQPSLTLDNVINFTFVLNENETSCIYFSVAPYNLSRIVVEPTGLLKQLVWAKHVQEWKVLWRHPAETCEIYPFCGASSNCNQSNVPLCNCDLGYLDDLKLEDHLGQCKTRSASECSDDRKDDFFLMPYIQLPKNSYEFMVENIEACRLLCLSNCSCSAYAYTADCQIWTDEKFLVQRLDDDEIVRDFYVRIAASDLLKERKQKRKPVSNSITAVVVVSAAFLVVLSVSLVINRTRRSDRTADCHLTHFEYRVLKKATKNFSEKIGEGGFSSVFRGALPDSTPIAVKKLLNQNQSNKQFLAEVRTIGTVQHVNVVRLRGFCAEESKRFLVYEYLANGSLAARLFQKGSNTIDWKTRYRIAIGTAKGLEYLHERCRDSIIHCDIKPENILLDSELEPQIADFGLAKIVGRDVSRVITTMRGTRGYLAPEWFSGGAITSKVDVFSYGKLLFELISGKRNIEELNSDMHYYVPLQVANSIAKGEEVLPLVDRRLNGLVEMEEVCRACKVACWCIQDSEKDRPTMSQVVQILEGVLVVEKPPVPRTLLQLLGS
ncbi:G-type lectin S-receptor-like serine/threonine-protein kinase At2g19130 [Rhodamnia argentea]|uniref:Receptor-like serine/threonine-protein kinase n=1 Tax=Rhodamnia argentea TaxID=178133 RepID=A0A8B8PW75_9MYRT|nr:G-type lectin S-receptor-like serine/threonine-protein kinase At2g19130 [Rhodamnia argentea]